MVVMYTVAGRQVGSHYLAMATFGSIAGIIALATSGKKDTTTPPIQAGSSDEEKFIKDFISKAEAEGAGAKAKT